MMLPIGLAAGCATSPVVKEPARPVVLPAPGEAAPVLSASAIVAEAKQQLERDDLAGAIRSLYSLPSDVRVPALRELAAGLISDPMRAARFALALPISEGRDALLREAMRAMAERDVDAAVAWTLALAEPGARYETSRTLAERLVDTDPAAAVDRATRLAPGSARDDFIRLLAVGWTQRAYPAAVAWARELPENELKVSVLTSIAFATAQTSPERALEIATTLPEGMGRRRVFAAVGQTWAARDLKAAWAWARGLPAGELRDAAVAGIEGGLSAGRLNGLAFGASALGTSALAGQSIASFPRAPRDAISMAPSADRDQELRRKFEELLTLSPSLAANWVATLPLPDRKDEMVDRIAREMVVSSPAMAESWMNQNAVPEPRREQVLRDAGLYRPPPQPGW